jgi:hypothetical protein
MPDRPTDVTGAVIRKIRGMEYVIVNVKQMFPGAPPNIRGLATRMQTAPDAFFNSLLMNGANAHVVRTLFDAQIGGAFPGIRKARMQLKDVAHRFTATGSGRYITVSEKPFLDWGIDTDRPIVLPMSPGFRTVMATATERRQREARLRAVTPSFEALEKQRRELHVKTVVLEDLIARYDKVAAINRDEVAIALALDALLFRLAQQPKVPPSADERADLEVLRAHTKRLKAEATHHLLINPPDSMVVGGLFRERERRSQDVLKRLQDPSFLSNVKVLVENDDVAPASLLYELCDTVAFTYRTLLHGPHADIAEIDIRNALAMLGSKAFDTAGLPATARTDFNRAVRDVPSPPPADAVLVVLVQLVVGTAPTAVGNTPGPAELSVAVIELAGIQLMPKVMSNPLEAGLLSGRMYRGLVNGAGLSQQQRVDLILAVEKGDLKAIRTVSWSARLMTSVGWRGAIAGANLIAFAFAIQSDQEETALKWAGIAQTGLSTAVSASVISFGRFGSLVSRGIVSEMSAGALGAIGGLFAIVIGYESAREELQAGDTTGAWIAGAGAAGGAISVAGYLLAAGAATSATGVGAPAGMLLMAAGAVVGIGSAVVGTIRVLTTEGSQSLFRAFVEHLERPGSPLTQAARERPSLAAAFAAVKKGQHESSFWDASLDAIGILQDCGFSTDPQIALIVDEDVSKVKARLRAEGRPDEIKKK